jgi:hypothetical protein
MATESAANSATEMLVIFIFILLWNVSFLLAAAG